jgi:hypothetical protein
MDHVKQVMELIRSGLNPGPARKAEALTLVPLFGGALAKDYRPASEAIAAGLLTITEKEGGSVPEVLATNHGDLPVLLIDGEHIEGAMQNRVLNVTVLIAPDRKTVLPVACVEHGRWHYEGSSDFAASEDIAYSRLRSKNAAASARSARESGGRDIDQGEVWADVAAKHAEIGVEESETGSMRHAFEDRRNELDNMISRFAEPEAGQTGVIACAGGRPLAMDAFDRPETLARIWHRLVSGYAMDALAAPPIPVSDEAIRVFLENAARANATSHEGVGLGMDVVLTSDSVVGHALTWEEGVVHLALFAGSNEGNRPSEDGSPIASPTRRRRLSRRWE